MAMTVVIVHCRDIASDAQVTLLRYPQGFGLMVLSGRLTPKLRARYIGAIAAVIGSKNRT